MNIVRLRFSAFGLTVLLGLAFLMVGFYVEFGQIRRFDAAGSAFVARFECPVMTAVMKGLTFIGSPAMTLLLTVAASLFLYFAAGHRRETIFFITVVAGALLLNPFMKNLFHRERPNTNRLIEVTGLSFPSGHSMAAFALYGTLCYLLWRNVSHAAGRTLLIASGLFMTAGIGISRIYLGVHYPSDVLGGYLATAAWLCLSICMFNKRLSRP
ncbi:phosphatase PAP2 family protein [Paenibacillus beijingensis]|uniref:Phosphatidic acid phosphatase type 2/haloperoxidase domain-containing protein n=1 Tax=Paenibacillus beijingensis TaxID=1126833 RepID=A0A0D5NP02_9BACL|nr:phosphatase PAP2 family protein [Paenibacillus beijingensis]AJY76727.1 hypothetical protein VN24_21840 [Paenibacillus beijingensis]